MQKPKEGSMEIWLLQVICQLVIGFILIAQRSASIAQKNASKRFLANQLNQQIRMIE